MATTDLAQIRTNVSAILGLDNTASGDQPRIDFYANMGVRKVLIETQCYVTSQTVTPGANADYTLASSVLEMIDWYATSSGNNYPLERVSVEEIMRLRRAIAPANTPTRYYALAGNNTVMFYPTPGASDTFTMYYVPLPTEMTTGANDPTTTTYGGIPVSLWDALEFYVLWRCADYDDDQSSAQGTRYQQLYMDAIARGRRHLRNRGGSRIARGTLSRRRRPNLVTDNSADVQ